MKKSVIHIGYHKTATTWFQKRCYPFVENYAFVPRKVAQDAFLGSSAFKFDPEEALRQLAGYAVNDGIILCEEELSGNVHSGGMYGCFSKEVAFRIRETLPEGRVVIFIRNQIDMAAALYRHYIREGGTFGPHRYFFPERYRKDVARHPFKYPLFSFEHLEFLGLIRHYKQLFGPEKVHVFAYEEFRRNQKQFVENYARELGLVIDLDKLDFSSLNIGHGRWAMALGKFLNRFSYRSVLDKHYFLNIVPNRMRSNLPRRVAKSVFSGRLATLEEMAGPKMTQLLRQRFAESNAQLSRETGLDLGRYGYPLPGP
jgi:hypothetical protein